MQNLNEFDFKQDLDLDAGLFYAAIANKEGDGTDEEAFRKNNHRFMEAAKQLGMDNPMVGIMRALWLMGQPKEYIAKVIHRVAELHAQAQVVN